MQIMNLRVIAILAFIYFICCSALFSAEKTITPGRFEFMSRRSLDIMAAYENYNAVWEEHDTRIYFDMDGVLPAYRGYVIPSTLDSALDVGPTQAKLAAYFKGTFKNVHTIEVIFIMNLLGLGSDIQSNLDLEKEENKYYGDLRWNSGNLLIGARHTKGADWRYTLGIIAQWDPYIVTGSDSSRLFGVYFDEEDKRYYGSKTRTNLFFDGTFWSFDFQTLYDTKDNVITYYQFEKELEGKKQLGKFSLGLNYYKFQKTYKIGFQYNNAALFNSMPFGMDFYWDIYNKDKNSGLGHTFFYIEPSLFRDAASTRKPGDKLDFYIGFNLGASYTKDLFDESLTGYSAGISFKNMHISRTSESYCNFTLGISSNYYNAINRLPIKNDLLVHIGLTFWRLI